jgi:hypothetical protein
MKTIATVIIIALASPTASANFLWATKAFWLKSHKGYVISKKPNPPPFITELVTIDPDPNENPKLSSYRNTLVVIGDRVMAYTVKRIDGEQMTQEDINFCLGGCSDANTKWNEHSKNDASISWMRSDNKIIVEYDRNERMAAIYDVGFYMIDKTINEANNMKENGHGDAWTEWQMKRLQKTE